MSDPRVRPRLKKFSNQVVEILIEKFQQSFEDSATKFKGTVIQHHVIIKIPVEEQHYWSPELHLSIEENYVDDADPEENTEGVTLIRGNIGPDSTVWTMFMFFYVVVGVLGMFGGMVGLSQWTLDKDPWGFWFLIAAIIIISILYISVRVGRNMDQEQMRQLVKFLDKQIN